MLQKLTWSPYLEYLAYICRLHAYDNERRATEGIGGSLHIVTIYKLMLSDHFDSFDSLGLHTNQRSLNELTPNF